METFPAEIWQEIFVLACTDTGYTGRSLSLVSKYINDISGPFKYQSLAITQWSQMVIFSQTFAQLPDSQKKIKYLFVNCSYHFVDVEDDPMLGDSSSIDSEGSLFDPGMNDEVSGESDDSSESESDSDSKFEGSLNSEDERELWEDVGHLRDAEIRLLFDNLLEALYAILNETSSTLTILGVYWTSLESPQIHRLLPPLPRLQELHLYRHGLSSNSFNSRFGEPPTTTLFPLLRFLYISGDCSREVSLEDSLARFAPKLTHIRFPNHYDLQVGRGSMHSFNLHLGGIIVEKWKLWPSWNPRNLWNQFETPTQFGAEDLEMAPGAWDWQRWWASRVAGGIGPWRALGLSSEDRKRHKNKQLWCTTPVQQVRIGPTYLNQLILEKKMVGQCEDRRLFCDYIAFSS